MFYTTKIGKFIEEHKDWEYILTNKPYCLKIQRDGQYVLFKYNQIESDFSNPIVQEARGIIFKEGFWNYPVCYAFNKFFNYGETNAATINWNSATVTEKVDGSLIKLWYDNNQWHISTNGTIDAYKACYSNIENANFGNLFEEALYNNKLTFKELTEKLPINFTYMFELVSPKTRVVIPYNKTDLYYLGFRANLSNNEFPFYNELSFVKNLTNILKTPSVYFLRNINECLQAAQNLPWDEEGYVACDSNCNRVKIKSPQYVLAHYVRNNNSVTTETLIDVELSGEQEEFLTYAEEYKDSLMKVSKAIKKFKKDCKNSLLKLRKKSYKTRKEQALEIQKYPENIRPFLFKNIDENVSIEDFTKNWNASKWLKYIET